MQKHIWLYLALAGALSIGQAQGVTAKVAHSKMAPLSRYLSKSASDEIALARSAAPAPIADKAQVLMRSADAHVLQRRRGAFAVARIPRAHRLGSCRNVRGPNGQADQIGATHERCDGLHDVAAAGHLLGCRMQPLVSSPDVLLSARPSTEMGRESARGTGVFRAFRPTYGSPLRIGAHVVRWITEYGRQP